MELSLSEIIESVDILEYISQFCDHEKRSDGEYWGLSPIKDENTPSFSVNSEIGRFYDFSSGVGGNVLDFIRAYHKCGLQEGVRILKAYANLEESTTTTQTKRLQATTVAKKFRTQNKESKQSKTIVLPDDYMDRYDRDLIKLQSWIDEGISQASLDKYMVRYDPFSDRIVYPIRDMRGNIINVSGRTLDPDYKERGLRKYTYFKPLGMLDTIYGFAENRDEILAKKEIILFEGAKSVMLADSWGIKNTGAILTSHLNPQQFQLLIRLGVNVVFALDAEINIRDDKNIMKLLPYVPIWWVRNQDGLLEDKDSPVDKGEEIFQFLYDKRKRVRG